MSRLAFVPTSEPAPGDRVKSPVVSVLLPTFNRPQLARRALQSLQVQSFSDFEVVVTDNSSDDETKKIIESLEDGRLRYFKNSANLGLRGNLLRALGEMRGRYFCWLGDDDLYEPDFLKECVAFLDDHPQSSFVGTRFHWLSEDGGQRRTFEGAFRDFPKATGELPAQEVYRSYLLGRNIGVRVTGLLLRADWFRVQGFRLDDNAHFDVTLRLELLLKAENVGFIDTMLHLARVHDVQRFGTSLDSAEEKALYASEHFAQIAAHLRRHQTRLIRDGQPLIAFWFYLLKTSLRQLLYRCGPQRFRVLVVLVAAQALGRIAVLSSLAVGSWIVAVPAVAVDFLRRARRSLIEAAKR